MNLLLYNTYTKLDIHIHSYYSFRVSKKNTWENIYDRSVRKNVKKAIRNNLIVKQFDGNKISDWWYNEFKKIYFFEPFKV